MRGKARIMLAAASVAAVALVISLVSVSMASTVTKVTVIEHATTDVVIDTDGDATDSEGDLLTFHNELFDESNTTVVGTDQGDCIRIEAGVSWECRWVNFLEGGSVTVEGPFFDAGPSTLAITGGTGMYKNASGTLKLTSNADGTEITFALKIIT
jgi:hypothetical protein